MAWPMQYYLSKNLNESKRGRGNKLMEEVMKTMKMLATMIIGSTSAAYAGSNAQTDGAGILTYLFIGFFALIVVTQLVPAVILFVSMLKGLFSGTEKTSTKSN